MKYVIIAGEASGDLHASQLIKSLKAEDPEFDVRFFGGDLMSREARRNPELHYDRMNVMGFSEVLRKLPTLWRNLRQAKKLLKEYRPDALILVDYPSFNLKLAAYARKLGIQVHYFISPKVWAWKEWRVKKIKKYVDKLYSILPFEVPFYQKHGYEVTYVGNPSVQEVAHSMKHIPPVKHFRERQGLNDDKPIIALLPGSRKGEIRNNLPLMIEAARRFPEFQYVVAAAPAVPEKFYREVAQDPNLKVAFDCTHTLLKYSTAAVVTSGTATLETALIGTPQVVAYRANGMKLSYLIMEKLLKVKYVPLPNLIVNNNIVPELLVHQCTADAIARELTPLLQPSPRRDWQISGYRNLQRRLGNYVASDYVAELIIDSLRQKQAEAEQKTSESNGVAAAPDQGDRRSRRPQRRPRPDRRQQRELSASQPQDEGQSVSRTQKKTATPPTDPTSGTPDHDSDQKPRKPRRRHQKSKSPDKADSSPADNRPTPQPETGNTSSNGKSKPETAAAAAPQTGDGNPTKKKRRRYPRRRNQGDKAPNGNTEPHES